MDKSKVIIFVISVFILFGLIGLGVYFLTSNNAATPTPKPAQIQLPDTYSLSVTEDSGTISAVATTNGQNTTLTTDALGQYAIVTFNGPRDIMWVLCPTGYTQTGQTDVEVVPGQKNNLITSCTKAK